MEQLVAALVVLTVAAGCVWIIRRRDPRVTRLPAEPDLMVPSADELAPWRPYTRGMAPAARILTGRR